MRGDQEAALEAPAWRSTPPKLEAARCVLSTLSAEPHSMLATLWASGWVGPGRGSYPAWMVLLMFSMVSEREVSTDVNRTV